PGGPVLVSTVFLGLNQDWSEEGPPTLWETKVFAEGCPYDQHQCRYTAREDALAGHAHAVSAVNDWLQSVQPQNLRRDLSPESP
ncbi:MAG TPA: hypothetical protein VGH53_07880, partial [Streptosporangiaceae bacterium]